MKTIIKMNAKLFLPLLVLILTITAFSKAEPLDQRGQQAISFAHYLLRQRNLKPQPFANSLVPNVFYSVMPTQINWRSGYTTYFVATRSELLSPSQFIVWIAKHISQCRQTFQSLGLRGYVAIATPNFEIAIQNWESAEKMQAAFQTVMAKQIVLEAGQNFKPVIFGRATEYSGVVEFVEGLN